MNIFRDIEKEMVYAKKDTAFTTSRMIAKEFNRRHDHLLKLISGAQKDLELADYHQKPTLREVVTMVDMAQGGQRKEIHYEMDRGGFMFLMMKMKGRKADGYKLKFIDAFNHMEQWIKDREVGRRYRLSMTDSIRDNYPESPNKKFKYKHFTDLVYKKVLGKNTKQLKEVHGAFESLRNICTEDQLKEIEKIETDIAILVKYGLDYSQIKDKLIN